MTAEKRKPRVGDECWQVEWCVFVYCDEDGTGDPDRNKYGRRSFKTWDEAVAFGRQKWPESKDGVVVVTPCQFVAYDEDDVARYPHAGFWQATDDSWMIEDESGEPVR